MKNLKKITLLMMSCSFFLLAFFCSFALCAQNLKSFSLKGIDGQVYKSESLAEHPLVILYFFDPASKPCVDGGILLSNLSNKYPELDIKIWAITTSSMEAGKQFCQKIGCTFPVLFDNQGVATQYNADVILPTLLIIGPELQILDTIQGGGKVLEVMMVRLAERELQRKHYRVAKKLSQDVIKKHKENTKAKVVMGYAELKEGNVKKAEKVFSSLTKESKQGEILGTEGLAAVHAHKGETKKALHLANKVLKKAPKRSYPHVLKGNILYAQGNKKGAKKEYEQAIQKPEAEPFQQGVRFNQLGRLYASAGKYEQARSLYNKAVEIDPFYIEGMANTGVSYEKEGKWDKALASYNKVLSIDGDDRIAALLAQKAEEMLELKRDEQRSRRIDRLVKELAQRYKEQKKLPPPEDQWTSRPLVLTFLGFNEKGTLPERDGLSIYFINKLSDYLNASGRVKVIERVILDKLLQELNIGSSELADKETALKLGNLLSAKLIGTGSFYYGFGSALLSFRLIDTETSGISMVDNKKLSNLEMIDRQILGLNRDILRTITAKYPLRGYIIQPEDGKKVLLNIGARQGVVLGTKFKVIKEPKMIVYKGRKLRGAPSIKGIIKVVSVEPDISHAVIIEAKEALSQDDKIEEITIDSKKLF